RVRVPLLRDPLVPELRVRGGERRPDPCPRTDHRGRGDGEATRHRRAEAPRGWPGTADAGTRPHRRARRAPPRRAAVRALRGERGGDRRRPAHRNHQGRGCPVALRRSRLALSQQTDQDATAILTCIPGAAATPARGSWKITRPGGPLSVCSTLTFSPRRSHFRWARPTGSPIKLGTTPCVGFGTTSVTWSYADSRPLLGFCPSTTFTFCPGR